MQNASVLFLSNCIAIVIATQAVYKSKFLMLVYSDNSLMLV